MILHTHTSYGPGGRGIRGLGDAATDEASLENTLYGNPFGTPGVINTPYVATTGAGAIDPETGLVMGGNIPGTTTESGTYYGEASNQASTTNPPALASFGNALASLFGGAPAQYKVVNTGVGTSLSQVGGTSGITVGMIALVVGGALVLGLLTRKKK